MRKDYVLQVINAASDAFGVNDGENDLGICLKFHLFLKAVFPESKAHYNSDHVITEIGGKFYDASGIVDFTRYQNEPEFIPMSEFGFDHMAESYRFVALTDNQLHLLALSCK